ncbi:MAG TPA: nucleoside monophosphate kinase, partial [Flexilinea sp.]|nr:nucleoside monophosphate kinase [Flexilinea sp.]
HPPKEDDICDICGQKLYQREDDKAETIEKRLEVYENQTAPLIDYYQKRNVLRFIDGAKDIDAVTMDILAAFKDVTKK